MAKQNATALPAPRRSACLKSICSRFVKKYKCRAEVQMIKISVVVWAPSQQHTWLISYEDLLQTSRERKKWYNYAFQHSYLPIGSGDHIHPRSCRTSTEGQ
jgi:hypothetical protein